MRAFVTGGSGFIGSHLLDSLVRTGWQVRALAHNSPIPQADGVEVLKGDIGDRDILDNGLRGVDILFHLASALGSATISKDEFRRVNAEGTAAVLESGQKQGVKKVIHFSSGGVLGAVKEGELADESFPAGPASIYDQTKFEGETIALRHAAKGADVVIVRPGWAYGPRDRRTFKLIKAIDGEKFFMATKGRGRQTPVYIDDLIQGILLAAQKGRRGEIYHLAGDEILSARQIVEVIAAGCGKKIPAFHLPLLPAQLAALILERIYAPFGKEAPFNRAKLSFFTHSRALSVQKAKTELGYRPEVDFKRGIQTALSWYRDAGWL